MAQHDRSARAALAAGQVVSDIARPGDPQYARQPVHGRIVFGLRALQNQAKMIHPQGLCNIAAQVMQEILEYGGVEHSQNGPVNLMRSGKVFVCGRND